MNKGFKFQLSLSLLMKHLAQKERESSWNTRRVKDDEEMKENTRNCGSTCGVRGTDCIKGGGKEILVCVCV